MIYFIISIITYITLGLGFALSSWLEVQEKNVKAKRPITVDFKMWVIFTLGWWLIAIYCYRAEIKRTIPTYHYFTKDK